VKSTSPKVRTTFVAMIILLLSGLVGLKLQNRALEQAIVAGSTTGEAR